MRGQAEKWLKERVEKCMFRTIPQLSLQNLPTIGYNDSE